MIQITPKPTIIGFFQFSIRREISKSCDAGPTHYVSDLNIAVGNYLKTHDVQNLFLQRKKDNIMNAFNHQKPVSFCTRRYSNSISSTRNPPTTWCRRCLINVKCRVLDGSMMIPIFLGRSQILYWFSSILLHDHYKIKTQSEISK